MIMLLTQNTTAMHIHVSADNPYCSEFSIIEIDPLFLLAVETESAVVTAIVRYESRQL